MRAAQIYEIENLQSAREYLSQTHNHIVLSNPEGSTKYYGMRVIDYIFKTLQTEFPDKIDGIIVDAYDDYSALVTAKELGYATIKYVPS
jgi:Asp/Glu/hydantoin racemase